MSGVSPFRIFGNSSKPLRGPNVTGNRNGRPLREREREALELEREQEREAFENERLAFELEREQQRRAVEVELSREKGVLRDQFLKDLTSRDHVLEHSRLELQRQRECLKALESQDPVQKVRDIAPLLTGCGEWFAELHELEGALKLQNEAPLLRVSLRLRFRTPERNKAIKTINKTLC
uniref:Uncharacterized protein n=1 Tax=Sphaerodactylus townsendi TaxID=933632 RepID=A0ACB8FC26_9SAUR